MTVAAALLAAAWVGPLGAAVAPEETPRVSVSVVSGQVVDAVGRAGVPRASVRFVEAGRDCLTDARGRFVVAGLSADRHLLRASAIGYRVAELEIAVRAEGETRVTLVLVREATWAGDEVVVTARVERHGEEVPVQQAAREMATTLYPDLSTVLQSLPGVAGAGHFDARLFVQGGASDEIAAWLDRTYVQNPYRWGGRLSVFNLDTLDRAELFKAGYPALHGGALSGILDVTTRSGNDERTDGALDVNAGSVSAILSGPAPGGSGSWLAAANRSWFDFVVNTFFSQQNLIFPYYATVQGKWQWNASDGDALLVHAVQRSEGLRMRVPQHSVTQPDRELSADVRSRTASLDWQRAFGGELIARTTVSYIHLDAAFRTATPYDLLEVSVADDQGQLRTDWAYAGIGRHTVKAGGVLFLTSFTGRLHARERVWDRAGRLLPASPIEKPLRQRAQPIGWAYVHDEWSLVQERAELDVGVIAGGSRTSGDAAIDPRAAAIYRPDPSTRLRVAAGRFHQFPIDPSQAQSTSSSPELDPERAFHLAADAERDFLGRFKGKVTAYWKRFDHLIVGSDILGFRNAGEGRAAGLDVYLQAVQRLDRRVSGWISYSLSRSRRRGDFYPGPQGQVARSGDWLPTEHDQRHGMVAVANIVLGNLGPTLEPRWGLSMLWKLHSGWPYTPILGAEHVADDPDTGDPVYFPTVGGVHSARYPPWHELNVRINYVKPLAQGRRYLAAYIQFMNLYNRRNVLTYIYSRDYREKLAIYDIPPGFLVLGGVRVEF